MKRTGKDGSPQRILGGRQGERPITRRRCKLQLCWPEPETDKLFTSADIGRGQFYPEPFPNNSVSFFSSEKGQFFNSIADNQ